MYGAVELTKTCHEMGGVKPIIGCEGYIIDGNIKDKTARQHLHHITMLAQNKTGYSNLVRLNSRAHIEGYYYKPRINKEMLADQKEGLIILSGCLEPNSVNSFSKTIMKRPKNLLNGTRKF